MNTPTPQQIEDALALDYAICKQVPAMRDFGFSVMTDRGEIKIFAEEGRDIATQVQRVLEDRLARIAGKQPGKDTISAEQWLMLEQFDACDADRQSIVLLLSHLGAGNPCTPEMSQLLHQVGELLIAEQSKQMSAAPMSQADVSTAFNQIFGASK